MYGLFAHICWISMVNVGKYTIHGSYGPMRYKDKKVVSTSTHLIQISDLG